MDEPEFHQAVYDALRGEAAPLARFGVSLVDVPWWRRRIQRYVMPRRFRLWSQREILRVLDAEGDQADPRGENMRVLRCLRCRLYSITWLDSCQWCGSRKVEERT